MTFGHHSTIEGTNFAGVYEGDLELKNGVTLTGGVTSISGGRLNLEGSSPRCRSTPPSCSAAGN